MHRKTNQAGINLIKYYESLRLNAYRDMANVLTIGYGHTGPDVVEGQKITAFQANLLLESDLEKFERGVDRLLSGPALNDNQFSALVSFAYNLGLGSLSASTLLKLINKGQLNKAADEFVKWDKVRDPKTGVLVESNGILARRRAERDLFLS